MRLLPDQVEAVRSAACENFGDDVRVWLFGSRVDDGKRGGDIDLLICPGSPLPPREALMKKIRFQGKLERVLGERRVDVVVEGPEDDRPIVRIARQTGIEL